ncbi:MAG: TolB family protein, partial [Candidatus Rokuibacteriota bacterium]
MRPLVHATLAVSCAALGASPLLAQAALRPLEIPDAVGAKRLHIQGRIAAISSDGELVAYTICDPRRVNAADSGGTRQYAVSRGAAYGSQGCDVWLGPVAGGETRNLTSGSGNEWGPSWSPDGRLLAFYSDRDGAPRVWLWDRQAGATRRLSEAVTRTFLGLEVPVWTPNGRHVVVKLRPETVSDSPPPAAVTVARSATADSAARSTVVVFRSPRSAPASTDTARAPSDESLADLGILDAGTGAARRLVRGVSTIDYKVSADGRFVAYLNQRRSATNDYLSEYFLAVASLEDGLVRELVPRIRQQWPAMAMSWSPDGRWLAYTAATPADSGAQRPASNARPGRGGSLFIVPVEDGTPRAFAGAPDNVFDALTLRPLW